jgi:DNA replicative helicase MCM subunit Mcm2 (Cdc46/Mcm family)
MAKAEEVPSYFDFEVPAKLKEQYDIKRIAKEGSTILVQMDGKTVRFDIEPKWSKTTANFDKQSKGIITNQELKQQVIFFLSEQWPNIINGKSGNGHQDQGQGQEQQEEENEIPAKEVSISEALRMHSGYVKVKDGMISGSRKLEKMSINTFFVCDSCKMINKISTYSRPKFAFEINKLEHSNNTRKCTNCSVKTIPTEYDNDVRNAIKIELQDVKTFSDLERLPAVLFDDCTINVGVGEQVTVTGRIYKIRMNNSMVPFLFVDTIEYENREELSEEPTDEDILKIKSIISKAREEKISPIDILVKMFASTIIGYEFVKKGLLICAANTGKDSVDKRLRINALLIGETGLDKSPLLRAVTKLAAKSRYCSALNSSIRSLIGIVDKEDDNLMLRLGPVTSSSGAICAIDEIGRMQYEDQGQLLNALQEGKIPFAKHGFNTVLDGSATYIMSANPTHDGTWRYENKIERDEIPLLGPFLDRNDLVFIFRTNRIKSEIIKYAFDKADISEATYAEEEKNFKLLRTYILYCKRFKPSLSHEAKNILIQFYASVATKTGSPRLFDTIRNIAYAIARLKQKDIIEVEDASDAVQFYNVILQQLEEIVVAAKDPRELAIEEIIKILNGSKYQFEFIELMRKVCNRNEFVSRYFGNDFHVDTNKKLRMLRDRFVKGGVDNSRILIVSLSPLVLAWKSSYDSDDKAKDDSKTDRLTDQTDQTDQTDLPLFDRSPNIKNENNVISDDNSSSKIDSNILDTDKNDDNNDDLLKKARVSQVSQVSQVSRTGNSENTTSKKFKCFYCDFYLSNDDERVNHIKSEHNGKLSWPTQEGFDNRESR